MEEEQKSKKCFRCNDFKAYYVFASSANAFCKTAKPAIDGIRNTTDICVHWKRLRDKKVQITVEQLKEAEEDVKILLTVL